MALTPEEIEEARNLFRSEMEDEHAERQDRMQKRREKSRAKGSARAQRTRQIELSDVREDVQKKFYEENGYKLYIDSTGREVWLSPDEYEWRMRRRKHGRHKRRVYEPALKPQGRVVLFYVGLFILAVVTGIVLAR